MMIRIFIVVDILRAFFAPGTSSPLQGPGTEMRSLLLEELTEGVGNPVRRVHRVVCALWLAYLPGREAHSPSFPCARLALAPRSKVWVPGIGRGARSAAPGQGAAWSPRTPLAPALASREAPGASEAGRGGAAGGGGALSRPQYGRR